MSAEPKSTTVKHAVTAGDKQRAQLERLFKDPSKPVYIPPPPKEKTIRPPKEMMKNVQGSSAGAGSGEFHVYKANRRREYERIKLMEEQSQKEIEEAEFERKKQEREQAAEAKTSRNRAKRQKKKERAAAGGGAKRPSSTANESNGQEGSSVNKKRRLVNGKELIFRKPGEEESDSDENEGDALAQRQGADNDTRESVQHLSSAAAEAEGAKVVIHDDE